MQEVFIPGSWKRTVRVCRVISAVLFSGFVIACLSWLWPGIGWVFDLAASSVSQCAGLMGVVGVVQLLRRRWICAGVAFLALGIGFLGIVLQPRADVVSRDSGISGVRIFVANVRVQNPHSRAVAEAIQEAKADVVILLETPEGLLAFLREGALLRDDLPYTWLPERAGAGYPVVLTRWPQHGGPTLKDRASATVVAGMRIMRVDRPEGAFALLVLHPDSPRTPARWRAGNAQVEHAVEWIRNHLKPTGLPLVVAGDLNSGPAGLRSRVLCSRAGVRRTKPLMYFSGTWPTWSPQPLRIAIDAVLVEPRTRVVSWETVSIQGSDHMGVLVELALPEP